MKLKKNMYLLVVRLLGYPFALVRPVTGSLYSWIVQTETDLSFRNAINANCSHYHTCAFLSADTVYSWKNWFTYQPSKPDFKILIYFDKQ